MPGQAQFVWEQASQKTYRPFYLIDKWYIQSAAPWPSSSPPGIKFHSNTTPSTRRWVSRGSQWVDARFWMDGLTIPYINTGWPRIPNSHTELDASFVWNRLTSPTWGRRRFWATWKEKTPTSCYCIACTQSPNLFASAQTLNLPEFLFACHYGTWLQSPIKNN